MTMDMTEGKPLPLILRFTLPLLLGNLFQQTYNLVDAIIVGRYLGTGALAAVGASSSVQFLILGFCIGLCCGFAVPVAQRFGAHDFSGMRQFIFVAALLTLACAAVLTTVCSLLTPQILRMLSTPQDIFDNAYRYLLIIFLGIPCMLLYNTLSGILRAVGDSRTPFLILVFSALLNIALDLLLIIVIPLGCAGAAIATVSSQAVSGLLCLLLIARKNALLHLGAQDMRWDNRKCRQLLLMGVPMGMQYSITAIGSMMLQGANNSLGSLYVSSFTAVTKIKQIVLCPFDALATAVSTFVSQNYGAGKPARIRQGLRQGVAAGVLYGLVSGLLLVLFGRVLCMALVDAAESAVLDAARLHARCLGFFCWLLGLLNVLRMSTQGLGFAGWAVCSGIMELVARCIVSLCFVPRFGYTAVCFADQSAWFAAVCYITPTCIWCVHKISSSFNTRTPDLSAAAR